MTKKLDISIGQGIFGTFKSLDYTTWGALAEFVDNAVQSYLDNKKELKKINGKDYVLKVDIGLNTDGQRIVIRDNAAGIAESDIDRAFITAKPEKSHTARQKLKIHLPFTKLKTCQR